MSVDTMANDVDRNPYVGVRPFCSEEASQFFGRDPDIRVLSRRWRTRSLTLLHGQPGVGKTSLLRAGLLPELGWSSDALPIGRVSRGLPFPSAALPEHNPYTLALLSSWSPAEPASELAGLTVRDFLRRRGRRTDHYGDRLLILAAIDQAEELFNGPDQRARDREAFLDELREAQEELPELRLLLVVREKHLTDFEHHFGRSDSCPVLPFSLQDAREAVTRPMEQAGRWFTAGTAEEVLADLSRMPYVDADGARTSRAGDTVEPVLLQVACSRLWKALPAEVRAITPDHVHAFADIDRSLTGFCGQAVAEVASDHSLSALRLASWLQQAFITEAGLPQVVPEDTGRVAGMPASVARALEDRHVLRAGSLPDGRFYTLQHGRLAEPLLRMDAPDLSRGDPSPDAESTDHLEAAALTLAEGELAQAERHAEEALRLRGGGDPRRRAEAELFLGNIAHARGEPAEAENRYRTAAALFETVQDTLAVTRLLMAIGRSLLAQGRNAEAVAELQAAAERAPNDPAVQTELGRTLWHVGQKKAGLTVLSGVLAANGDTPEALWTRGEMLADLGQAKDALRDLDRIRRRQRPATRAARALALATLRNSHAAGEEIDTALADAPDSGPVLLYAARIGALGGDSTRATELARRAAAAKAPALSPHQREEALRLTQSGPDDPPR